ncbi:MAG TPA: hypothetical protein VM580_26945 [Labilithrix sp.]|nr:hypothetical protein [Labilithrix sp.]
MLPIELLVQLAPSAADASSVWRWVLFYRLHGDRRSARNRPSFVIAELSDDLEGDGDSDGDTTYDMVVGVVPSLAWWRW